MAGKYITYESLDDRRIARITLNRVGARNAQNRGLLVELGDAFLQAEADDEVRVVILAGAAARYVTLRDPGSQAGGDERYRPPTSGSTAAAFGTESAATVTPVSSGLVSGQIHLVL